MVTPEDINRLWDAMLHDVSHSQKDIYVDAAEKSKKLYVAHLKVGFNEEQALALTCALLQ